MLARSSGHIIAAPLALSVVFWYFGCWLLTILAIAFFVILIVFFRDPGRKTGRGVVAPADGVVRAIVEKNNTILISTFMNLHNVHVNRAPISGQVISIRRRKGGYKPAFMKKANNNSSLTITLRTKIGVVKIRQIAGTFAWRIVPYARVGKNLRKGEKIGIIRFGSRVDLLLPAGRVRCVVDAGDKLLAGSSTVAEVVNEVDK